MNADVSIGAECSPRGQPCCEGSKQSKAIHQPEENRLGGGALWNPCLPLIQPQHLLVAVSLCIC